MTVPTDLYLTTAELCDQLGCSTRTALRWRKEGVGPRWFKLDTGGVRYRETAVAEWLRTQEAGEKE